MRHPAWRTLLPCGALLALAAGCETGREPPLTRPQAIAELAAIADIDGVMARTQSDALARSRVAIERARAQFAGQLDSLSAPQRERLEAATDRFVSASRSMLDPPAAAAVWVQAFAGNLSDEELRQVVQFAHTPAGRQELAGSVAATAQLQDYLARQREAATDKAYQQYLSDLATIVHGR